MSLALKRYFPPHRLEPLQATEPKHGVSGSLIHLTMSEPSGCAIDREICQHTMDHGVGIEERAKLNQNRGQKIVAMPSRA
jgi:hypothetical protein